MLSQEELINRAAKIVAEISEMTEDDRKNVSAQHMANEIAYARLLFDMSESNAYWNMLQVDFREKISLIYSNSSLQPCGDE